MLSIAICDDVLLVAQKLKNIVRELMLEEDEVSQIQIFTSGELLLPIVDILFLDIKMPGKDGIDDTFLRGWWSPDNYRGIK